MGDHYGNALAGRLNYYVQYANQQQLGNSHYMSDPVPPGWGINSVDPFARPVPLTFIAKLRHEIKEWHGNILGKQP